MRILQVVTLVSPDGAYGGPLRVAVNQSAALRSRGHEVTIASAVHGFVRPPRELEGTPTRLFRAHQVVPKAGFAGLAAPAMIPWFRAHAHEFDVVHVHMARDLVTLPLAICARHSNKLVIQTHGMVDPSSKALATPLDTLLTRPALRASQAVLYLTQVERRGLLRVEPTLTRLEFLPNGVPTPKHAERPQRTDEVLFLARLQKRKRPLAFVDSARQLSPTHPGWAFTLVGPDEGEGQVVERLIRESRSTAITWEGPCPPDAVQARLRRCAVYVLPSIDEPFPMSVLEAMAVGVPVVVTNTCGLAETIRETGSGIVVDASVGELTRAIAYLLDNPTTRQRMAHAAVAASRTHFDMDAVVTRLLDIYMR